MYTVFFNDTLPLPENDISQTLAVNVKNYVLDFFLLFF